MGYLPNAVHVVGGARECDHLVTARAPDPTLHGCVEPHGLLAAGNVRTKLKAASDILACRQASNTTTLSEASTQPSGEVPSDFHALLLQLTGIDVTRCPVCSSHAIERRPLQRAPSVAA